MKNFHDYIMHYYLPMDPNTNCRTITFQVTDDCCLKCSYCYQINKSHRMMTGETGKKIIDLLYKMYDENKEDAFINHHTKGIILEFIGGEPFMNVDTMNIITEYFLEEGYKRNHPWLTNFVISISSNGVLYFEPKVQEFLKKYNNFISMTITIDGPQPIHDACRVDHFGIGSFDRSIKAWKTWKELHPTSIVGTKVTIAPENMPFLFDIIKFFIENGVKDINANPIYEHRWTSQEGAQYYQILKQIADYLLEHEDIHISLFNTFWGHPLLSTELSNWCGGTGYMLSFDPDGLAFPCIRYMESSLGNKRKPLIVGNTNGIYNTNEYKQIYNELNQVDRRTQSTDECFNCHIASGCAWCSAWNYQHLGSFNKRDNSICWMHRALSLANVYYWNKYYISKDQIKRKPLYLSRDIATQLIDNKEYDDLYLLSLYGGDE